MGACGLSDSPNRGDYQMKEYKVVGEYEYFKGSNFYVRYEDLPEGKHKLYVLQESEQRIDNSIGSDSYLEIQIL